MHTNLRVAVKTGSKRDKVTTGSRGGVEERIMEGLSKMLREMEKVECNHEQLESALGKIETDTIQVQGLDQIEKSNEDI